MNNFTNSVGAAAAKIEGAAGQMLGALNAVGTFKSDTDEVAQAEKILREALINLRRTASHYQSIVRSLKTEVPKLNKANVQMRKAAKAAEAQKAAGDRASKNFDAMKKDLAKLKRVAA